MSDRKNCFKLCGVLTLCACLHAIPASADAYLDALNAAADDVELDPNTKQEQQRSTNTGGSIAVGGGMPSGMSREDFEAYLQRRYIGSFAFYKKLNTDRKRRVYESYRERADIDYVRDQIKRQYLDR